MLPAKQNKIDLSKLTEEERKIFKMYGRLPSGKDLVVQKLKDRKYFDSGDYALKKAGQTSAEVGSQHPSPEKIPHASPISPTSSLQKEASMSQETASAPHIDKYGPPPVFNL
ncbi:Endosulfine-domain-containing protein [Basidiobolus meristosporus CBS 931.73]|uniref:mRNA stability protein n=1 Tax=Basidiobolus meristosporus CBS 931.73 TaxID=1314790 RepID=A0A1Y1YZ85_9FUNG|nr:Endosulfine-domain-containing protein [Basidiobolus meristosporus CBS 931.73]|eukprot:ORY03184.1 Endosulfine-domain-containing protein [Basidiobolus meristosporus CBS 931.73]